MRFKCLVLDHDDTVVQTEKTMGYPYFRDHIERIRPGKTLSYEEYVADCNNMVFADMCRQKWGFTDEELLEEYTGWKAYSRVNIPALCEGMDAVIQKHKDQGGIVCVSSLSTREIIERDFMHYVGFLPDAIYDNDLPSHLRKPNTYALTHIMEQFQLSPSDILMVDDMKLGWQMAHDAGVASGFAGWSKLDFPKLAQEMQNLCDYSFSSPKELEEFLFG